MGHKRGLCLSLGLFNLQVLVELLVLCLDVAYLACKVLRADYCSDACDDNGQYNVSEENLAGLEYVGDYENKNHHDDVVEDIAPPAVVYRKDRKNDPEDRHHDVGNRKRICKVYESG